MFASYVVRVLDRNGQALRRFVVVASYGRAMRAGYEAADMLPNARDVVAIAI